MGISPPLSLSGLETTIGFLKVVASSPLLLKKWIYAENLAEIQSNLSSHRALYESLLAHRATIVRDYDKEILGLDYYPILQRFRSTYTSIFRVLKREYRNDIRTLGSFSYTGLKLSYTLAKDLLNYLKEYREKQDYISSQEGVMSALYENYYVRENTDWEKINEAVNFAIELKAVMCKSVFPDTLVEKIYEDDSTIAYCKDNLSSLTTIYNSIRNELDWFFSLFENLDSFKHCSFQELASFLCGIRIVKSVDPIRWIGPVRAIPLSQDECQAISLTRFSNTNT